MLFAPSLVVLTILRRPRLTGRLAAAVCSGWHGPADSESDSDDMNLT
jgi:hypothetical protein